MRTVRSVSRFAFAVGEDVTELEFHRDLLGLPVQAGEEVAAGGAAAQRIEFGAAGEPPFLVVLALGSTGPAGRAGSNAPRGVDLSVPGDSLDFWQRRLAEQGVEANRVERLESRRLEFAHPLGCPYSLVECEDPRPPLTGAGIGDAEAIRGLYGVTLSLNDAREAHAFLTEVLGATHLAQEVDAGLYGLDPAAPANRIELRHEPYRPPATWTLGVGVPHHVALEVEAGRLEELRAELLAAGFRDLGGEQEAASLWVRIPGGTLVELVGRG